MILGIDIGGTTTKVGVVKNRKIEHHYVIDTNPTTLIDDLIKSFSENKIDLDNIDSIGCAIPGFIEHKKGIITLSGNMGYKNYDFKSKFEKKLNKSVYILNDANAAALGEYWVGAGEEFNSIILYTLGTGLGGGIVVNNELVFGSHGYAGELGHGGFFQNERECSCGLSNCIEPMSSATGIEKSLYEELQVKTTVKDSVKRFIERETKVINAYTKSLKPLASHIAIMETALNPDAIIIGGGPSNMGDSLSAFITELVSKVQLNFINKNTPIITAKTKNYAGIYGAAYWAITNKSKETHE